MVESSEISSCLEDFLEAAFLPKLKEDLDSVPIQKEHFANYEKSLKTELPVIFDLVQQQQKEIHENGNEKLKSLLILLCCELTAPETIFHLDDENLLRNAQKLLKECRTISAEVDKLIFDYYQTNLTKDEWKRQLGAVHGFEQYIKSFHDDEKKINANWLSFGLSVGLIVRDCHDSCYKHLGIRIFLTLLKYSQTEDMCKLNIHGVIYDSVFKDVHFMESVAATEDLWTCLFLCLDYLQNIDSFNWSQVDDLLEILIRNVPLASNSLVSICMFNFVPKLCAYFTLNREEILSKYNIELEETELIEECCKCCAGNTSYNCFRWAKSILDLIVFESYKLMHGIKTCLNLLRVMNRCYMICILPIPLQVAEPHVIQFYEKFTSVLLEAIVTHKQQDVKKLIKIILKTFVWQLNHSSYVDQSPSLTRYRKTFQQLLQHSVFL